jgi:hypothetical protein
MPSRVPALIDWLVTAFTASPALGAATPPVAVYDGPVTTAAPAQLILWVGVQDPDSEGAAEAAVFEQARSDLGQAARDETSIIRCTAEAWPGTDDVRTARVAAFAITAAAETIIRADATNFGGNAALAAPGVTGGVLLQNNVQGVGAVARVTFDVIFRSFT